MTAKILGVNAFKELKKDLKEIDVKAPKLLAKVNREVSKFIVGEARAKAHGLGGVFSKSAPAITASGAGGAVAVFLNKTTRPYAFGAEFGSKQYKQFDAWRGNNFDDAFEGGPGYMLFPAIRENKPEIKDMWLEGVEKMLAGIKSSY